MGTRYLRPYTRPQGHWEWLARLQPQGVNWDNSSDLLPSPHNRYQWQAHLVKSTSNVNSITTEHVTLACNSKGIVQDVAPGQGLVVLSSLSLPEAMTQLSQILASSPDSLWLVTSGSMKISANDAVTPTATAMHSLLRVARTEYPNKQFFMLDSQEIQPTEIAKQLAAAPFYSCHDLAYRDGQYWSCQLEQVQTHSASIPPDWFNAKGTHLITGAMGGIGRLVIRCWQSLASNIS